MMIDLRSDTVTRPSGGMMEAMMGAVVGDDVLGDDPTVKELEQLACGMFGMEAGLFCPSGTMTNQIAINVHTRPGQEVILHRHSHVYYYEGGGMMRNSGVSVCLLEGEGGRIKAADVRDHINPDDIHRPTTSLVEVENTMNKGGGSCYNFSDLVEIGEVCRTHSLKYHLDGARLFNALVEGQERPEDYGGLFDSVSICLSKGLGAPVGSLLLGRNDFIRQGRKVRKAFGGAMRQSGFLAAAGIYALQHNITRLREDNERARYLGAILTKLSFVESVMPSETNILIFTLNKKISGKDFLAKLKSFDIHALAMGPQQIRFVTHLDFTDSMLSATEERLRELDRLL